MPIHAKISKETNLLPMSSLSQVGIFSMSDWWQDQAFGFHPIQSIMESSTIQKCNEIIQFFFFIYNIEFY